jgi:hypothetical protein
MRTLITLLAVVPCLTAPSLAGAAWIENPDRIIPGSADKPLLLFFHRSEEVDSRLLETWTFSDPLVMRALQRVLPVSIDLDQGPNFGDHFRVDETPTLLLITPEQHEVARHLGHLDPDEFVRWLNRGLAHVEPDPEEEEEPEEESAPPSPTTEAPFLITDPRTPPARSQDSGPLETLVPRHRPPRTAQSGHPLPLQVDVPGGADRVVLHHRRPGARAFNDVVMTPNTLDLHYAVVPPEAVTPEGVEYYITITLGSQSMTLPPQGPGRPHLVGVH